MCRIASANRVVVTLLIALAGVLTLAFLYFCNPSEVSALPRCPFYALTGYKCPGCGTLRAIHAALHFRLGDAVRWNPILVGAIPLVIVVCCSRRVASSAQVGRGVLLVTVAYWILRNVFSF